MQNLIDPNARIVIFTPESPPSYAGAGINAQAFATYLSNYSQKVILWFHVLAQHGHYYHPP